MAMTREERIAGHKKQERTQVKSGIPSIADLKEGMTELRFTGKGVSEYTKYMGVLYKKVLDKVSPETKLNLDDATLTTSELNLLDGVTAKTNELNLVDDMVASVSFSVASESSEAIIVSCQFKDAAGSDMTSARCLRAYLSVDSAGQTAANASGLTITSGTDGLTQVALNVVSIKMMWLTSEADGDVDVVITDASGGTLTNYLNVVTPDGKIHTSGAITFA